MAGYSSHMETIPAIIVDEDERLKAAFASALLKHPDTMQGRFAAALSLTSDTGKALVMANKWLDDPIVIAETLRITGPSDDDPLNAVFSKQDLAREIWRRMKDCWDNETYAKLMDQALKLRGWNKPDTQVNVQVNNHRVMVVKDMGTDDDWERKAQRQQRELIDVSASRH